MHVHNCKSFQDHLRMRLQSLRALYFARRGPGSIRKFSAVLVRSTGVSGRFGSGFQTGLRFTDVPILVSLLDSFPLQCDKYSEPGSTYQLHLWWSSEAYQQIDYSQHSGVLLTASFRNVYMKSGCISRITSRRSEYTASYRAIKNHTNYTALQKLHESECNREWEKMKYVFCCTVRWMLATLGSPKYTYFPVLCSAPLSLYLSIPHPQPIYTAVVRNRLSCNSI